jgi:hypothetical protein
MPQGYQHINKAKNMLSFDLGPQNFKDRLKNQHLEIGFRDVAIKTEDLQMQM